MELWIRSQDRHNLLKIDRLDVDDCTIQANFKVYDDSYNYIIIGRYKTNKRALEVLDEIQEILKQEDYLHIRKSSLNTLDDIEEPKYILRSCGLPKVYEMPEE